MTVSAVYVRFDDTTMWVELSDERTLEVPLAWFPRLQHATPEKLRDHQLTPQGIHWEALDEDLSLAGLLSQIEDAGKE